MKFEFRELPGERSPLARPVIPVQFEDLEEAIQLCLVDTGSRTNRFGKWLADAVGMSLAGASVEDIIVGGIHTRAVHARAQLAIGDFRYEAPVTFCDPWPLAFNLLGQEGFLRFFRVTLCAREFWLDVEPERDLPERA